MIRVRYPGWWRPYTIKAMVLSGLRSWLLVGLAVLVACKDKDEGKGKGKGQAGDEPGGAKPGPVSPPAVAPAAGSGAGLDAAPPEPPPPPSFDPRGAGPTYLGVEGSGLVRVSDGKAETLIEHTYPILDIAIDARGVVYVAAIGGMWSIAGRKVTKLPAEDRSYDHLAVGPDGALWALEHQRLDRWDGKAWTDAGYAGDYADDLAVDTAGRVWVATSDVLWRRDGTTWSKVDTKFAGTRQPFFRAVAASPTGEVYVSCFGGVFVSEGERWKKVFSSGDELAVGADGLIAASGGLDGLAIRAPGGAPRTFALGKTGAKARQAKVMAVDGAGRTWLATDQGVVILDGEGALVQQWSPGTVPGITGKIEALAVAGKGPRLPELTAAVRGTVTGKVVSKGKPVAGAAIEMCASPVGLSFTDDTPCGGAPVVYTGVTRADGTFEIADVAVGSYGFAVRPKRTWFVTMGTDRCCPTLEAGGAYDIGALELDKVE